MKACEHFLSTSSHNTIPSGTLCDLVRMILTMNNFTFNDNPLPLNQRHLAKGTKMAPACANCFIPFDCHCDVIYDIQIWHPIENQERSS